MISNNADLHGNNADLHGRISFFSNITSVIPEKSFSMDNFLNNIKSGEWQDAVQAVRGCTDKERRDKLKLSAGGVTASGLFSKRNSSSLIQHSGFICIDIDERVDRNILVKDPYSYAVFDSITQRGFAVIVKIAPEKHDESFSFLQKHYFENYGIVIDSAPRNIVSLRCVSYDPDLFVNPKSKISKTYTPKKPKHLSLPLVLDDNQISQLVHDIVSSGTDIAPDYEDYYQLSLSLASGLGEQGREYFHQLCQSNPKYKHSQADKKYNSAIASCKSNRSGKKITIGTFFHLARKAGITLPKSNNNKHIAIAAIAKKTGRTQQAVAEQLVRINHVSPQQASHLAEQVFSRDDITLKTLASDPEHLIESLIHFIQNTYPLRRNEITQRIERIPSGSPITDEDINDIYLHARAAFNSPQVNKDLVQSIIFSSHTKNYNPLVDFINKHKHTHTSTGHIDKLISSINTTTPHARQFMRKWIIAIHAAIEWNPVRMMLTFTGPQYNGKTEFFRRLLPKPLQCFYAESKLDRGKDDELLMCQKLIVMDDEMGGKSKQDEKRLKELTSKEYFTLRAPYRRDNMDYRRLAILCGTSNPTEIINDPTGNTRILPVKVDSIDYTIANSVDRTALFMEAYHNYKAGEQWELTKEEITVLSDLSEDFSSISFERELIHQFFAPGTQERLTATEIKNEIEVNTKQQIKNMQRFGIELRKIFGDPKPVKRDGISTRCYFVRKVVSALTTGHFSQTFDNEPLPF